MLSAVRYFMLTHLAIYNIVQNLAEIYIMQKIQITNTRILLEVIN